MKKQEILILIGGVIVAVLTSALTFSLQKTPTKDTEKPQEPISKSNPQEKMPETTFSQTDAPNKGDLVAEINTTKGVIKIKLFPDLAPKTVENFKLLADRGYYDGIIFHRVIDNFMIQTGDPEGNGTGGESAWGGKFDDEFAPELKNIKGALSMANAGPNTNGSQFFIVQAEQTPWLNGKHAVFGQVYEGLNIVDEIAGSETNAMDKPVEDIKMEKVKVYTLD